MLPDEWYLKILTAVLAHLDCKTVVRIYSEGMNGKYCDESGQVKSWASMLADCGPAVRVEEWVDAPFMDTFHQMASSEILIGSRSGMTHLAALISDGAKIVPDFWHSYRGMHNCLVIEDLIDDRACQEIANLTARLVRGIL